RRQGPRADPGPVQRQLRRSPGCRCRGHAPPADSEFRSRSRRHHHGPYHYADSSGCAEECRGGEGVTSRLDTHPCCAYVGAMSIEVEPKKKAWTEAELEAIPEDGYSHEVVNGELV